MLNKNLPVHSTESITWETYAPGRKRGVTEISSLMGPGARAFLGRVYDDAADVGMVLKSHKTGAEIVFLLVDTVFNKDGDVTHWMFDSLGEHRIALVVFSD